ncbi:sigma-70 family RNA polymerase sigma factor [Microbacterium stercoris]|uniref:Sigma-70 family RNA polymerase sigma factor n=1 Tax=Microbacterium stercoris TaxID=2820289 RepID=A0A939QR81_9MICO|nr:sigma-70 family RNA polymerase sigma factor [Microbacterium stercoris]MBO3663161.1 sigma-70 family RNA polymerase sigma factor [Microbacterium stercoris]
MHDPSDDSVADTDLILRSRSGDADAFALLWQRHYAAGIAAARSITSSIDPDDLVQEAYTRIFQAVRRGGGPTGAFRAYLFTAIRHTAASWGRARHELATDELDAVADPGSTDSALREQDDRTLTHRAFRSLPTRWQEVLWYTEVEGLGISETAPLLGMKPNAVKQLAFRAREGLREAWIQAHIGALGRGSDCRWAVERLGAATRGNLAERHRARFEAHLSACRSCTLLAAEAGEVGGRLALALLPLFIGVSATASYLLALGRGPAAMALAALPAELVEGAIVVGGGAAATMPPWAIGAGASGSGAGAAGVAAGAGSGSLGGLVGAGMSTVGAASAIVATGFVPSIATAEQAGAAVSDAPAASADTVATTGETVAPHDAPAVPGAFVVPSELDAETVPAVDPAALPSVSAITILLDTRPAAEEEAAPADAPVAVETPRTPAPRLLAPHTPTPRTPAIQIGLDAGAATDVRIGADDTGLEVDAEVLDTLAEVGAHVGRDGAGLDVALIEDVVDVGASIDSNGVSADVRAGDLADVHLELDEAGVALDAEVLADLVDVRAEVSKERVALDADLASGLVAADAELGSDGAGAEVAAGDVAQVGLGVDHHGITVEVEALPDVLGLGADAGSGGLSIDAKVLGDVLGVALDSRGLRVGSPLLGSLFGTAKAAPAPHVPPAPAPPVVEPDQTEPAEAAVPAAGAASDALAE